MDLAEWLRRLGLEQYEAAFRESAIDADVLPDVTDQHLKDMGVALGHRLKILRAIRELRVDAPIPSPPPAKPQAEHRDAAERRQLTVMFCDLVGSTALAARFDPEDMRGVIGAYHQCCASLIAASGGFVAKYMGDGVLAYFGYPQAHEHDAERAVRAGLAIVEAAPNLQTPAGAPLHVRVGIATGIVVVGDLLGSGESQERGVVGDTPNLAARLQGIAAPDSVVIAEGTRKLLGDLFELRDLGPQDLKGVAIPARAYEALRASSQESRFEALHAGGLTPLVGREEEIELLLRRWAKARAGEGQVVLLSGEAGIGKSRLTAAFLERLMGEPHVRMRYFCSPQHTDSALHPIIGHMERAAGFAREDDAKVKLDKLDGVLAQSATSREDAALLADMLSLPNDGRHPALELAPQQRRQKTLQALIAQIGAIARKTPVLMIFEDAHWADPSSLEAFSLVVDKIDALRAFLFVTFRPEFVAPWIGRSHVTALTINRLTRYDVEALIDRVAGNKTLPVAIRQDIVERADGVPLFVEEMTKAVLEAGSEGGARLIGSIPSPALAVPASLHASLMARLDRLGEAKGVAQIGAAIGREFSHALLAPVAGLPEPELAGALDRLIQSGLMSRQGVAPHATYLFKHALVQDTAYGTLLREPRRALHGRIADVLEAQVPDIAESEPELLAHHCAEAGLTEKAASLWGRAGQRSWSRSATVEAEAQFRRGLNQIATLPATPETRRLEINLQTGLATALMYTKGFAAPEVSAAFEQTRLLVEQVEALGEHPDDPWVVFSLLIGFYMANFVAFDADATRAIATQCLSLAEKQGEAIPLVLGHSLLGAARTIAGDFSEAVAHFDRATAIYRPDDHSALFSKRFGFDLATVFRPLGACAKWALGFPEAARADVRRALADARRFGFVPVIMGALHFAGAAHLRLGEIEAAKREADEFMALANETATPAMQAHAMADLGCALALGGETATAALTLEKAIAADRALASRVELTSVWAALAKCRADLGEFDAARRCIGEATALMAASGERWWEAEISRVAGEIELAAPERDPAKAERCFERALEIARAQEARSWELRAAMSLARLWRDRGKRAEAHALLSPVYGWFTEGFDTSDLKEAKALLEALG